MSLRPRLHEYEQELWDEFLPLANGKYDNFKYDIQVKPQREILNISEKEYYKNWDNLTSPRIDVYGINEQGQATIFEVRRSADFTTLAKIIAYSELMKTTGQLQGEYELVLICREITKNTQALANMKGIKVYRIPELIDKNQTKLI